MITSSFSAVDYLFLGQALFNDNGLIKPALQLSGLKDTFYGASAYHHAETKSGVIIGKVFPIQTEVFRMFKTETTNCKQLNKTK